MMKISILFIILTVACQSKLILSSGIIDLGGGLCREIQKVTKLDAVWEMVSKKVTYRRCGYRNCWTESEYRLVPEKKIKVKEEFINNDRCCSGYLPYEGKESNGDLPCIAECIPECINGDCVRPGECYCKDGFKKGIEPNICLPSCTPNCQNSTCINVNTCKCFEGYEKHTNFSCSPVCSYECVNGSCIEPEKCSCNDNFRLSPIDKYLCEPICTMECLNGNCTAPEFCSCNEGYVQNVDKWNICDPFCAEGCVNGFCLAPENCECFSGYNKTSLNDNYCDPICKDLCVNGFCSEPGLCSCNEGYEPVENKTHECYPFCSSGCQNGNCTEPETCECFEGYNLEEGGCEAICANECINSNCTEPGRCSCHEGLSKITDNECVKICESVNEDECYQSDDQIFKDITLTLDYQSLFVIPKFLDKSILSLKLDCSAIYNENKELCQRNNCNQCARRFTCYSQILPERLSVLCHWVWNISEEIEDSYRNKTELSSNVIDSLNTTTNELYYNKSEVLISLVYPTNYSMIYQGSCNLCLCNYNQNLLNPDGKFVLSFYPCENSPNMPQTSSPGPWQTSLLIILICTLLAVGIFSWKVYRNYGQSYKVARHEFENQLTSEINPTDTSTL